MKNISAARQFFDDVFTQEDPFAYLAAFVGSDPPTFETEWLDFKGHDEGDPLRIWSEAVSGFANTAGGVLVWGLDGSSCPNVTTTAATAAARSNLRH